MSFDTAELFISIGPNPRLVRMFLAEKGVSIPERMIDLVGGENRRADYLAMNPGGQMPALRLGSGQVIAETIPICEYVEECRPDPALIGATAEQRGETRMWLRRVEGLYVRPMLDAYRYGPGIERFRDRMRCLPEAQAGLALLARDGEAWLDAQLGQGPYLAGDRMTLADIVLYCMVDFAEMRKVLPRDTSRTNLFAWFDRMSARPSAAASARLPG